MGGDWKDMFAGVERNDLELVKYYISGGIDLNYQHPEYMTSALLESIRCGHEQMTALLLENGASPSLKEVYSNYTPLSVAKSSPNKAIVSLIERYLEKEQQKK